MKRFVELALSIDPVSEEERLRAASRLADKGFWARFRGEHIDNGDFAAALADGVERAIAVEAVDGIGDLSSGPDGAAGRKYVVDFTRTDRRRGEEVGRRKLRAWLSVEFRPHMVREADKYVNPFGLTVTGMALKERRKSSIMRRLDISGPISKGEQAAYKGGGKADQRRPDSAPAQGADGETRHHKTCDRAKTADPSAHAAVGEDAAPEGQVGIVDVLGKHFSTLSFWGGTVLSMDGRRAAVARHRARPVVRGPPCRLCGSFLVAYATGVLLGLPWRWTDALPDRETSPPTLPTAARRCRSGAGCFWPWPCPSRASRRGASRRRHAALLSP